MLTKRLTRAPGWIWADFDALFKERPQDALAFFIDLAKPHELVGAPKAS